MYMRPTPAVPVAPVMNAAPIVYRTKLAIRASRRPILSAANAENRAPKTAPACGNVRPSSYVFMYITRLEDRDDVGGKCGLSSGRLFVQAKVLEEGRKCHDAANEACTQCQR